MQTRELITEKLRAAFAPESLRVEPQALAGCSQGCEARFLVHIVSEAFRGKSRLERQRMINAALANELAAGVDALAIHATAPGEQQGPLPFRIFISSPGDVSAERRRAALVIEKLAKDYGRFFEIKPYLWETEPMLASGHFQDAIVPPGETDIVVLILWSRLGTPLPKEQYRGIDGRAPVTGTEWEYEAALAANSRKGVPDLLAYKKKASPKAEYRTAADVAELGRQLERLETFWARHFVDRGEIRAAFADFDDLDNFELKLENDLRRLIERRAGQASSGTVTSASATWLTGSPFRGLETYLFEHAPIFFGRSDATKTAVENLVEAAEGERPFLLVLGASGAGKSSLAQAGIVPALTVRGVVPSVGQWRHAVVRPGGHPGGPFMALATGLSGLRALPEMLNGQDLTALAEHLRTAAAHPSFPIVSALTAREKVARDKGDLLSFEEVRLILVVDQLEELFTLAEVTPEQRKAFILCLKGLMDSKRVFVIATMRSDYWHRAAETPQLVALAEGKCRLDLMPPSQAEITEMIRRPAEAAGLSFEAEARSEVRLDAALAEEASREPGALPLLSFLLDALFLKDVQERRDTTLRYASMRALGGLKGAIATRAEAAFSALPPDAKAKLPTVLRTLVTVSRAATDATARPVPMGRFAEGSPERQLVDAFLHRDIRLLVAGDDGAGPRIRIAHEALITHWERARHQIAQDRDELRTRTAVEEAEAEYRKADARHKNSYLLRDPLLANAVDLAERWHDGFEKGALEFIDASYRHARRWEWFVRAAAAVFALTTIAASVLGYLANQERNRAEQERNRALYGGGATVSLVGDLVANGILSTDVAQRLLDAPSKTVSDLENERGDDATVAVEWHLLQTLSAAYLVVPGGGKIALEKANKMKALADKLTADKPDDQDYRRDLAASNVSIADALELKGDFDTALKRYGEAKTVIDKLIQNDPSNPDLQRDMAYIQERMGDDLYTEKDFEGALSGYKTFLDLVEKLAGRNDAKNEWIRRLALAEERMGDALRHLNQIDAALDRFLTYQRVAQGLVAKVEKESPNSPNYTYQLDLLISYERIGAIRLVQGRQDEAIENYTFYIVGTREVAARNLQQGDWRRFLANGYIGRGDVLLAEGKSDAALADFREALRIYAALVAKDKFRASWQRNLALTHQRIGEALQAEGKLPEALAEFQACSATQVDESAVDAQVEIPPLLHADCQKRTDEVTAALRGK
jgi:stress-induced morphogen/tetratricopeptide (TPR) repeat protein